MSNVEEFKSDLLDMIKSKCKVSKAEAREMLAEIQPEIDAEAAFYEKSFGYKPGAAWSLYCGMTQEIEYEDVRDLRTAFNATAQEVRSTVYENHAKKHGVSVEEAEAYFLSLVSGETEPASPIEATPEEMVEDIVEPVQPTILATDYLSTLKATQEYLSRQKKSGTIPATDLTHGGDTASTNHDGEIAMNLSNQALKSRFTATASVAVSGLKEDGRLRPEVLDAIATEHGENVITPAQFKAFYIARVVFDGANAETLKDALHQAQEMENEESGKGVEFLISKCAYGCWKDAVIKSCADFQTKLMQSIQLEKFAEEDFGTLQLAASLADSVNVEEKAPISPAEPISTPDDATPAPEVVEVAQMAIEAAAEYLNSKITAMEEWSKAEPFRAKLNEAANTIGGFLVAKAENRTEAAIDGFLADFEKRNKSTIGKARETYEARLVREANKTPKATGTGSRSAVKMISQLESGAQKVLAAEVVDFFDEKFNPEDGDAYLKGLKLENFLALSDYASNRDAKERALSAKPAAGVSKGKFPHLCGKLVTPQQSLVKVIRITKENCPKTWEKAEEQAKAMGYQSTLPYVIADAHSRKYAWMIKSGEGYQLERPEFVNVMVYSKDASGKDFTDATFFQFVDAECSKFTAFTNAEANDVSKIEADLSTKIAKGGFVDKDWSVAFTLNNSISLMEGRKLYRKELLSLETLNLPGSLSSDTIDSIKLRIRPGVKGAILASVDYAKEKGVDFDTVLNEFWKDFFNPILTRALDVPKETINQYACSLVDWIEDEERVSPASGKAVKNTQGGSFDAGLYAAAVADVKRFIDSKAS